MSSDLVVFAKDNQQLANAQEKLIMWAQNKLMESELLFEEMSVNLEEARRNGWKLRAWQNQKRGAEKKVQYYEKILAALNAGYVIIPDFPFDVFAIRTNYQLPPSQVYETKSYWQDTNRNQTSESPALGEGEYVGNLPLVRKSQTKLENKETLYTSESVKFQSVDFPVKLVKPIIVQETGKALALKIFDEVGICPPSPKGKDPMVIGSVIFRHDGKIKRVNFLITWWLRQSDLEV